MDRKDLDLNGVARCFTKNHVLITHCGTDSAFSVYQHALASHFARNPVVWKRNNKVFPHLLTFNLKFVPFDENLCFGPQINPAEAHKIAYLHIFNISVGNLEEYKSTVRHNVSDWFAKLNSKNDVQWIIIINTSRIRDRKTKASVMDKIRSDFSKHHSKLFELPDTTDHNAFTSFVQSLQQFLFHHLNLVVEIWDTSLKTAYEKRKQPNFDCYNYFVSMVEYGRFHWSFGAVEFAITIFDDLEQLFNEFVLRASEHDSPRWLTQLLNIPVRNRPDILVCMGNRVVEKDQAHYIGMRNYLLSQQIVLAVHLYQQKMKSNDAAPSLRSDCVIEILRRALISIESVKEFNTQLKNEKDESKTNCWIWWTVNESIDICNLLCDVSHLDPAVSLLSRLHLNKFDAVQSLFKFLRVIDDFQLDEFLKKDESNESKTLLAALRSVETMASEMEKVHDVCVHEMHNSARYRCALHVTQKLFDYLRIGLIFFIIQCENGGDEAMKELFFKKCQNKVVKWDQIWHKELFLIEISRFQSIQTIGSNVEMTLKIVSQLGFVLSNSRVVLHFDSSPNANIGHSNKLSVLSLQHDSRENVCRLVSEFKIKKQPSVDENRDEKSTKFELAANFDIQPGENNIKFSTDINVMGCFVLEKVSIISDNGCLRHESSNISSRSPPILICISTPHSISVINDTQPFLAGVVQKVEVEIEAKNDILSETNLQFLPSPPHLQFLV
ncbi:unnamed protein product [Caenorhabditis bovis]|uniref:TRAPPC10/Trs130 N-terminal domain-containing protein n=1 Tax=Caenorhabditis bovis TaxID=2654633 RepID=A0A8S1EXF9_9PELO|nr:unnamed protein product [Caenorhabditis bovis]